MERSRVLLPLVVVLSLVLRAAIPPVYVGAPLAPLPHAALPLAQPFGDDLKGSSDAWLSLQARSLVEAGLAATGGFPLFNYDPARPADFAWYDHHPPGVPLVTALAFRLFGASELVARSVALLFATITLALVTDAVRRALGAKAALIAAAGLVGSPMGSYWATHLDYQVPTIAAGLAFLRCTLPAGGGAARRILATVALAAALCFDFLALFAVVALGVERLVRGPRNWKALLGWPLVAGVLMFGLLAWKTLATGRYGRPMGGTLLQHVAEVWNLGDGRTLGAWVRAVIGNMWKVAGPLPLLALAAALPRLIERRAAPSAPSAPSAPGAPGAALVPLFRASLVFALLAGLVPRGRAFDHEYFQLGLQVPAACAFALTIGVALERRSARPVAAAAVAAALLATGLAFTATQRPGRDPSIPSAHRLGAEFARSLPPSVRVVALPPDSAFNEFTPIWYAGRLVRRLEAGKESRRGLDPTLGLLGLRELPLDAVQRANDPRWPGRGGFEPLPR